MRYSFLKKGVAALALGLLSTTASFAGTPLSDGGSTRADLGSTIGRGGDQQMTVTVAMKLRDPVGAEALAHRMATPGDSQFRKFLTSAEIRAAVGPEERDVARAMSAARLMGFEVRRETTTTLKLTAPASIMERAFNTRIHDFEETTDGKIVAFHAATRAPSMPSALASIATGVFGLSNRTVAKPHVMTAPASLGASPDVTPAVKTTNRPGFLTVTDFEELYDAGPLMAKGINGSGRTLAVATLASVNLNDVLAYFSLVGLPADASRFQVVEVDGGSGPPSQASGSDETALDLEQSAGIATGAKVIVYEAPNQTQAFVDVFSKAVEDNLADSISTSFGLPEIFDSSDPVVGSTAVDIFGETESALQAMHDDFVIAALQGQSVFAAAGDSGAFDTNRDLPAPFFSTPLSVDYPASDSAITAAGGTTIAATLRFRVPVSSANPTGILTIKIPTEQVWGWDYLQPLCNAIGFPDPIACGIFSVGTGGGVSSEFGVPVNQRGIKGVQDTQPNQQLIDVVGALQGDTPGTLLFTFPANFDGRNVPDIATNADPETGYIVVFTLDGQTSPSILPFFGGTSFVAPQLNGVTALLGQNAGGERFGLLNVPLYLLDRTGLGTRGPTPAIKPTLNGDNFFYHGGAPFTPAAGLGTPDISSLANLLK